MLHFTRKRKENDELYPKTLEFNRKRKENAETLNCTRNVRKTPNFTENAELYQKRSNLPESVRETLHYTRKRSTLPENA